MTKEIRILIADDHFLIREGLKNTFSTDPSLVIVGEVHEINDLINQVKVYKPDILVLEINLCDRPVHQMLQEIKTNSPSTKVLIVSDCYCELPLIKSIRGGISGFIRKNVSQQELTKAIYSIYEGINYYAPEITQILANGFMDSKSSGHNFSDREIEILRYICKGRSNEQIGDLLFISENTVGTHRRNIMKKAQVKKTSDLIIWALANQIVST